MDALPIKNLSAVNNYTKVPSYTESNRFKPQYFDLVRTKRYIPPNVEDKITH